MQAIILAAGRGKRLGAITGATQKCLVRAAGKPIIERILREIPEAISEIIFVVGYFHDKVQKYFGKEWDGRPIRYVKQKNLLGSGHALWAARKILRGRFLVLNGDDLYQKTDLEKLLKHDLAILVYDCGKKVKTGQPIIDKNGNLKKIIPNSESRIVNTGAYLLDKRIFSYELVKIAPTEKEFGLPHTIATMARDWPVRAVKAKFWMPAGTPKALAKVKKYFANHKQ